MKTCPRCRGGLYRNEYAEVVCICCGWVEYPLPTLPLTRERGKLHGEQDYGPRLAKRERMCYELGRLAEREETS